MSENMSIKNMEQRHEWEENLNATRGHDRREGHRSVPGQWLSGFRGRVNHNNHS